MNLLVDTNIMLRSTDSDSPHRQVCDDAIKRLIIRGDVPHLCAQTAIEFWSVATRPKSVNGLALAVAVAEAALAAAEQTLVWLPEPPDIAARWRVLVNKHGITGRKVFDTRLVALMEAHAISHLLTLNASDFACYTGITCLDPAQILT